MTHWPQKVRKWGGSLLVGLLGSMAGATDYFALAEQAGAAYGLPPNMMSALVWVESRGNPYARSHVGAIGLAQLMPGTAAQLGVNPYDPWENLLGGAQYLRQQWDTFRNWDKAIAAYNAGPGRVRQAGGIPNIPETINYVQSVKGRYFALSESTQPKFTPAANPTQAPPGVSVRPQTAQTAPAPPSPARPAPTAQARPNPAQPTPSQLSAPQPSASQSRAATQPPPWLVTSPPTAAVSSPSPAATAPAAPEAQLTFVTPLVSPALVGGPQLVHVGGLK